MDLTVREDHADPRADGPAQHRRRLQAGGAAGWAGPRPSQRPRSGHRREEVGGQLQAAAARQRARHRRQSGVRAGRRGVVHAYNADTGEELWSHNNGIGHNGGIISYRAGGKQYIAVTTGWGSLVADEYRRALWRALQEHAEEYRRAGCFHAEAMTRRWRQGSSPCRLGQPDGCRNANIVCDRCFPGHHLAVFDRRSVAQQSTAAGSANPPAPAEASPNDIDGEQMFATTCGFCHQEAAAMRAGGRNCRIRAQRRIHHRAHQEGQGGRHACLWFGVQRRPDHRDPGLYQGAR